uniref:Uncharacterized protein n=1 Tax=Arion vulgaris TaxID=1028688 RepID=A0A0B7AV69_9EUPU
MPQPGKFITCHPRRDSWQRKWGDSGEIWKISPWIGGLGRPWLRIYDSLGAKGEKERKNNWTQSLISFPGMVNSLVNPAENGQLD